MAQQASANGGGNDHAARQAELASKLFSRNGDRLRSIVNSGIFSEHLHLLWGNPRRAGKALEKWRVQLTERYVDSEKDTEAVCNTNFVGMHASLIGVINTIVELMILPPLEAHASTKGK